ncbi:MAG: 23S rRNA (guanosine(2251)-2'-O)-methyltransferase RlmB [Desulfomonilia bacterium]|uniref:Putative TrmH family tRNA/rRNA methyltransferase n=1 Tax=anaerobic digester metagenome TaxID=1263854 RepID=A0A485LZ22_9ZZZZ|nr:23S rRNA (guanosine(2251)-2'-O)-methyltransferase RlmB [Pseudomonadota bacterium]HON38945.1 23S rRNA (guanosine(2251)-2'-O)-methyltransferase RlmB [Deltaproteobacteria bacterium]HRR69212.1 23S rRNA (guanosine(2251)-2'-O)-methyltransferase RlmB [Desulfomonilia bacterium]HPD22505.1 23S rRNA (guanosine(2251)-2'-O)-methyltransferase RlmB [Deltaproteobacteria bacterium]HPX17532.1 23S rRNA (guanosine(2251)-2'-O)-methyltransferase RlmB [Deltaproteobacteria bacterium]
MEVIYGKNPVMEALAAGRRTFYEIMTARQNYDEIARAAGKIRVITLSRKELDHIARSTYHQGVVARVSSYPYTPIKDLMQKKVVVLLDSIEDPQNTGAIIRSAYALADAGIIIPEDRAAHVTPAVIKASAGAAEHASIARVKNLRAAAKELKKEGFWVVGLDAQGTVPISEVPSYDRLAVVLGGEDVGIRSGMEKEADIVARIPMKGSFNSLNVSQSASIALYELVARKNA